MYKFKQKLSKRDKEQVLNILTEVEDIFCDFYFTLDNKRIFINRNPSLLFKLLSKGEKIIFGQKGILVTQGFSDKSNRIYVKVLADTEMVADKLLQLIDWNVDKILFAKVNKNNFIINSLKRKGYRFNGNRGSQVLFKKLKRKYKE